ncbi:lamin tail domain-containing protein [Streptomyces sp. NPDC001222]|uniref:lamin tail domain-containing protein n=1 Tax=Streptomyces sp. NPDC001222 TaxID=3364548 RepID=UPI0036D08345
MSASANVIARRLTAAALTAGAVVGALTVPASAADHRAPRPDVEISRVQYDSPGPEDRSNRSLNAEWVEITNTTRREVDLDHWTLSNKAGQTYTFHHYRLAGRATVRIHTGIGLNRGTDLFQDRRNYVWDNYSDTATLRNDHSRLVDVVSWGGPHRRHGGRH